MAGLPWPWRKVEELEKSEEKEQLEDDFEKAVQNTKQSMSDGLERLKKALAELEAEVHAIKGE